MKIKRWLGVFLLLGLSSLGSYSQSPQQNQTPSSTTQTSSSSKQKASDSKQKASPSTSSTVPKGTSNSGSYTNSAGQRVQSPTRSSTVPTGATAQCRDGSYSFSQSRRGTCSHHGGVSRWLTQ